MAAVGIGDEMKINEIEDLIKANIIYQPENYDIDILYAGASDLMSDVLAFLSEMPNHISNKMVLITGLVNPQSIRTASLTDMSMIVFTRGKTPLQNVIDAAKKTNIAVLVTPLTSYKVCGILYSAGIKSIDDLVNVEPDNATQ